jgi:hypothetical protein
MENALRAIMKKLEIPDPEMPNIESVDMEDLGPKKSASLAELRSNWPTPLNLMVTVKKDEPSSTHAIFIS